MNRWGILALLLLTGCASRCGTTDTAVTDDDTAPDTDTGDTGPDADWDPWESGNFSFDLRLEGRTNHIMNGPIAIDQERDLVYSTAFMTPSVAQIDANTGELLQIFDLSAYLHLNPKPAVDGDGIVWLTNDTVDALIRLDPTTGESRLIKVPVTSGRAIAPRSEGGVVLAGFSNSGSLLMVIDSDGTIIRQTAPPDPVLDVIALRDGESFGILALDSDGEVSDLFRISGDLAPLEPSCKLDFRASGLVETFDGRLLAISSSDITLPSCESGETTQTEPFGFLGTEAVALPDGSVMALDRRGLEDEHGLLVGRAYHFTLDPLALVDIIPTGHNTGYGRLHEDTGILWINGEDQGEVVGIDITTGEPVHVVQVAQHLEYAVADPDDPALIYVTGRLAYLSARVDLRDGELVETTGEPARWPIAPLAVGREVWYYEQSRTELRSFDMDTMVHNTPYDLGRADNELHTFGGINYLPETDTFFAANSKNHEVIEVDRATGEVLGQWSLAGQDIHPTDHGIVEVKVHGGLVYATQSLSSVVTVIDPAQSTPVLDARLSDEEVDSLTQKTTYQISFVAETASTFYVSGYAFDIDTMERTAERDLDVDAVVGELQSGHLVGWRAYEDQCVLFDPDLNEIATIPLDQGEYGKPLFLVDDQWGGRLITSNMGAARLDVISLQDLITTP